MYIFGQSFELFLHGYVCTVDNAAVWQLECKDTNFGREAGSTTDC